MKFTLLFVVLSILVIGVGAAPARADITVMNPSFEITNPLTVSCGSGCAYNFGPIPDWTLTGQGGSWHPSATYYNLPLPDGSIVAFSNGGMISQTLTTSLTPDTTYTLSVDVGHRLDGYTTDYSIALDAGGKVLKSISGTNGVITAGTFADETLTFTTGSTVAPGDLSIVLTSGFQQIDFDDVKLTASTVPEPSSLSLLAGGLGLLLFARRRR